jgi:hypothetical protein
LQGFSHLLFEKAPFNETFTKRRFSNYFIKFKNLNEMKNTICLFVIGSMLLAIATIIGYLSLGNKANNAQTEVRDPKNDVAIAHQDLLQAIKDTVQQFKKEPEENPITSVLLK